MFFVARITKRKAVRNLIARVRVKNVCLDVMSAKQDIGSTAILTGVIITLENSLTPFLNLFSVTRGRGMGAKVGLGGIELSRYHCSPAFMGTKDVSIAPLRHLFNFGWVTLESIPAKGTIQDGLNHLHSLIGTLSRAIVAFWLNPGFKYSKILTASVTGSYLISVVRPALSGAIVITLISARYRHASSEFLAAVVARNLGRNALPNRFKAALTGAILAVVVVGVKRYPATFTDFCI